MRAYPVIELWELMRRRNMNRNKILTEACAWHS
jgi:hypothetical protein